jgi:hypothetical protein
MTFYAITDYTCIGRKLYTVLVFCTFTYLIFKQVKFQILAVLEFGNVSSYSISKRKQVVNHSVVMMIDF